MLFRSVGFEKAIAFGLTPFVAGAIVKAALAVALLEAIRRKVAKPL